MPQASIDVVRRSLAAWDAGGIEAACASWASDVEWDEPGAPVLRGAEAVAKGLERLWGHGPLEITDVIAIADEVLVWIGHAARGNGVVGCAVRVTDGKLSRLRPLLLHAR